YMRQMGAYNRDATNARKAYQQLLAAEQSCQNSAILPVVQRDKKDVQQVLGLHEEDIAKFYIFQRQAYKAGESRLRDIINNYPLFDYYDKPLSLRGAPLAEKKQPEEAAESFTRLVRDYSNSKFAKKGKEYLKKPGKPTPPPANNNP